MAREIMPTPPKKSISVSGFYCLTDPDSYFLAFGDGFLCTLGVHAVRLFILLSLLAILVHLNICQISEKVASSLGLLALQLPLPTNLPFWPTLLADLIRGCCHDPFVAFVNPNSNGMHKSETKHTPQKGTESCCNN